jgi:short-subunit dehydrogenase
VARLEYRDRVAIVTGASSGIGYVTAVEFARRGCTVVAVARREENLARLIDVCKEHAPKSFYLAGDLGERAFARSVVDSTFEGVGRVDFLINNAGVSKHKQIYHLSADEAERVMQVNFLSCVWTTLAAIPYMLRTGEGWIVNVSSFVTKAPAPRESLYIASKSAMNGFTEGLWSDLEGSNIHAALVIPGPIDTEIWQKEDEPVAYTGPLYPPELVANAIFEVIEKRLFERVVPRWSLSLLTAAFLRRVFPAVLRFGLRRMDPVPTEVIAAARRRANLGRRLGDVSEPSETPEA